MFRKIAVLAAGLLCSMSASAGYVQYNFSGPISGSFVQHDDNGAIANYRFSYNLPNISAQVGHSVSDGYAPLNVTASFGGDVLTSASTSFLNGSGPTNFGVRDNTDFDNDSNVSVRFVQNADGTFGYIAQYSSRVKFLEYTGSGSQWVWYSDSGTLSGLVTQGALTLGSAGTYDANGGYYYDVPAIIPTFIGTAAVPEPASIALFAAGALGLAGLRRRKPAR